jgi:hypothetical protein
MSTSVDHAVIFASQAPDHEAVHVYHPPQGHLIATHSTKFPLGSPAHLFEGLQNTGQFSILVQSHGRKTALTDVMSGHTMAQIQHEGKCHLVVWHPRTFFYVLLLADGTVISLSVRSSFV